MQVLSVELAALDIKMRNTILKRVLVPLQISIIKPVFFIIQKTLQEKEANFGAHEQACSVSLLASGAKAKGPGLPGSSLPTVVCVKLKAMKKIKFHPNTVRRGDARTLNSWEFICWFLNSANANSIFKTLAEKLGIRGSMLSVSYLW